MPDDDSPSSSDEVSFRQVNDHGVVGHPGPTGAALVSTVDKSGLGDVKVVPVSEFEGLKPQAETAVSDGDGAGGSEPSAILAEDDGASKGKNVTWAKGLELSLCKACATTSVCSMKSNKARVWDAIADTVNLENPGVAVKPGARRCSAHAGRLVKKFESKGHKAKTGCGTEDEDFHPGTLNFIAEMVHHREVKKEAARDTKAAAAQKAKTKEEGGAYLLKCALTAPSAGEKRKGAGSADCTDCTPAPAAGTDDEPSTPIAATATKKQKRSPPVVIDEDPLAKVFREHAAKKKEEEGREREQQNEKHAALLTAVNALKTESQQQTAALKAQPSNHATAIQQSAQLLKKLGTNASQTATVLSQQTTALSALMERLK